VYGDLRICIVGVKYYLFWLFIHKLGWNMRYPFYIIHASVVTLHLPVNTAVGYVSDYEMFSEKRTLKQENVQFRESTLANRILAASILCCIIEDHASKLEMKKIGY